MVDLKSLVKRQSPIAWREIEGKIVIMTAKDSMLHTLNEVASHVWKLLEKEMTVEEVVKGVLAEFDVSRETAQEDVCGLIDTLMDRGVVVVQGSHE